MQIQQVNQKLRPEKDLAKVRRNYQLTIPQGLREKVGISVGDYVQVGFKDGSIFIKPVSVSQRLNDEREGHSKSSELVYEEVQQI